MNRSWWNGSQAHGHLYRGSVFDESVNGGESRLPWAALCAHLVSSMDVKRSAMGPRELS